MALTNLIPTMTSNTAPTGVASASTETEPAYKAFDKNISSSWLPNNFAPSWLQYQFATSTTCNWYSIATVGGTSNPGTWELQGSTTGAFAGEEVVLDTQIVSSWVDGVKQIFYFDNSTSYTYYRLDISAFNSFNMYIKEMELGFANDPIGSAEISVTATGSARVYPFKATSSVSVTATALSYATISDTSMFTFVYTLEQAQSESKFKFVYSLEQPKTATIIERVKV